MGSDIDGLQGLRVAAFENRRGQEMARMIQQQGGEAFVSAAMREVPLESNSQATEFANQLLTGQIDVVIFLTGVGFQLLLEALDRRVDKSRFIHSLQDTVTIARGPKPVAALKKEGVNVTYRVPEPNTWRELLEVVDRELSIAGQRVVIQEYGRANPSLMAGLEARGADVMRLPVYRWDLPEDCQPLQANLRAIAEGQRDVVLFTSAQQVVHALRMAHELGLANAVRTGIENAVVGSIGPTTSEELATAGLPVDIEPQRHKLGHFIATVAASSQHLLARKRRVRATLASEPASDGPRAWENSLFMRACRCLPTDRVPIWLMRQAGRYLPEYRKIRERISFLELCKRPDLCAEIMVHAVDQLGVDAAIIFSDLLPILEPMGLQLDYPDGGPVIHNPVRDGDDVARVVPLRGIESLDFVCETVQQTRAALAEELPLIGFAGAPFTLASYVIEGGPSQRQLHTKTLMRRNPAAWHELLQRLSKSVGVYLNAQIRAGVQCVQLFDSWVGCLSAADYREFVLPHVCDVLAQLPSQVPVLVYSTGDLSLLSCLSAAGPNVISADWRVSLDAMWDVVGSHCGVQGNLDPTVLFADEQEVRRQARGILQQCRGRNGFIFNLGGGILPQTPLANVKALVDEVQAC